MLGQASFLAWAGPGQLWQGQAGLGQVRPAQASLGSPEQDIFLHGYDRFTKLAVGNKQPHVQYERAIYRLEKTTLT